MRRFQAPGGRCRLPKCHDGCPTPVVFRRQTCLKGAKGKDWRMRFIPLLLLVLCVRLPLVLADAPTVTATPELPDRIDLRPDLDSLRLVPRTQGSRPTCSVFTVAGALEFAVAKRQGHCPRLSVPELGGKSGWRSSG
jgi:hypothetical protein